MDHGSQNPDLNSMKDIELNSKDIVFEDSNIYVHYEEDAVTIPIVRRLGSNSNKIISSVCRTRPLTAISGLHFVPMRDNLTFGINESQKFIRLDLNQKDFENEEGTGIIVCIRDSRTLVCMVREIADTSATLISIVYSPEKFRKYKKIE